MKECAVSNLDDAVVVALGSNMPGDLGSSEAVLEAALRRFSAHGLSVVTRSGWWRSAAWPDPTGPAYTNGVVLVETALSPIATLGALHAIEAAYGRVRGTANASRTLDLDLVAFGRLAGVYEGLALPHPRAAERLFVMGPLAEIAPGWRHPVSGLTAAGLAAASTVGVDARPVSPRNKS